MICCRRVGLGNWIDDKLYYPARYAYFRFAKVMTVLSLAVLIGGISLTLLGLDSLK